MALFKWLVHNKMSKQPTPSPRVIMQYIVNCKFVINIIIHF